MNGPKRAMVLAAGFGQRLRPLTASIAKPALPFLGTRLVEYAFRRLSRMGVHEAVLNLHHLPDTIEPLLARLPDGLVVHVSRESELLGTAGGLKHAERHLKDDTFLVMNGDTIFDFDLAALVATHAERGAEATLILRSKTGGSRYSTVSVDADGRVLGIDKRDRGPGLMFAGVWLMEPSVLDELSGEPGGLEVELLPRLIERGAAFASIQGGAFVTIDTPARYWSQSLNVARNGLFEPDWGVKRHTSGLFCGDSTRVPASARIEGTVVLGERCHVGRGARLRNVVGWDDVDIPAGASVEDAVLTEGVQLEAGAELTGKLVMRAPADTSGLRRRELDSGLVVARLDTAGGRETRGTEGLAGMERV